MVGVVVRWRAGKLTPADAYVAICLLLLLGDLKKPERYFLPLAPFLIGYLIGGASAIAARYTPDVKKQALKGVAMMWVAWLLLLDGYVLFVGDLERSRGGLSTIASPSVEDYYRGKTLDLYQALRWADGTMPSGEFAASGFHGKYVLAFTGRGFRTLPDDDPQGAVALVAPSGNLPDG